MAITILAPLAVLVPDAYANSSNTCIGSTVGCVILKVHLNVTNGGTISAPATVTANRVAKAGTDDSFTLSASGGNNDYSSGGYIWGTSPDDGTCSDNPNGNINKFTITVTGSASGAISSGINMCANEPPKATGSDGAKEKDVTVNVNAGSAGVQLGGIKGSFANIDAAGNSRACDESEKVSFANGPTTGQTASLTTGTNSSTFNTGLELKAGKYDVSVNCSAAGSVGPIAVDGVVVNPGQITDIGLKTCDARSNGCGTPGGANPVVPSSGSSSSDADGPDIQCSTSILNPLTWLVCPLVDAAQGAVGQLNNAIDTMLTINTGKNSIFDLSSDTGKSFQAAWNQFRVFSTGIIILGGLLMVIAQAAGVEFLDAYTIRKIMPRLLIAAIFITLSWYIMVFLVQLTNDVGNSVRAVIYSPFSNVGSGGGIQIKSDSLLVANLVGGAALFALGLLGIGSFALTALIAVFFGFVVLVIRNIVILLLIIVSPLAIACYVLPNTQKVWNFWKDTLSSMLLAFPIISAFIAAGRVFAVIVYNTGNTGVASAGHNLVPHGFAVLAFKLGFGSASHGLLPTVEAFSAYFLPYFFLNKAINFAHSTLGAISGAGANLHSRVSKWRGERRGRNWQNTKTGQRFKGTMFGTRKIASLANAAGERATTKRLGFGAVGRASMAEKRAVASADFSKTHQAQAGQYNDSLLRGLTYDNESQLRANFARDWNITDPERASHAINEAVANVKANGGFGKARKAWATVQLAATGTGYDTMDQALRTAARTADGNEEEASRNIGNIRAATERAGRNDLKGGFGAMADITHQIMRNGGSSNTAEIQQAINGQVIEAARGTDNSTLMRNKKRSIENISNALSRGLVDANYAGNANDGEITAKIENMKGAGMFGPEVNTSAVYSSGAASASNAILNEQTRDEGSYLPRDTAERSNYEQQIQRQQQFDPRNNSDPPDPPPNA